ncbi:MAG TPA: hypothetical protein VK696_05395 [Steroidobacteraceae bacterium]|jgi:hypothetical protein|nr:hypothetical protein [Steroidobacteraceae bacterium]
MAIDAGLAQSQLAYQAAVERWISAIRTEERLASATDSIPQVDQWERAHFQEEEARARALTAKKNYESALRQRFFQFR